MLVVLPEGSSDDTWLCSSHTYASNSLFFSREVFFRQPFSQKRALGCYVSRCVTESSLECRNTLEEAFFVFFRQRRRELLVRPPPPYSFFKWRFTVSSWTTVGRNALVNSHHPFSAASSFLFCPPNRRLTSCKRPFFVLFTTFPFSGTKFTPPSLSEGGAKLIPPHIFGHPFRFRDVISGVDPSKCLRGYQHGNNWINKCQWHKSCRKLLGLELCNMCVFSSNASAL